MIEIVTRRLMEDLVARANSPVIVIEGPRAVGKTTALRRVSSSSATEFSYATLEDTSQRADAQRDPYGWLMRQRTPLIIDEAQLVPGLLNAVKRLVDTLGPGTHIILTGSASLSGDSLGGRNPLAGRSEAHLMWPLTTWELDGQRGSVVDALFDGEPVLGTVPHLSDTHLVDEFLRGGLPLNRFSDTPLSGQRLASRVENDLRSRLSDRIDPTLDFDVTAARAAADHLLCTPGTIFNAQRLSQELDMDARTARRYLDVFHRLFLMWSLRNLASSPTRQGYQRLKIYPFDTAFAADALRRAGVDPLVHRETFGALLEAHVAQQVGAAIEWSTLRPQAFYWRDKQQREVDLVLRDGRGRLVGIEVKSTTSVGLDDARGLRALGRVRPLHRSFIVYRGDEVRRLGESTWAIPAEALGNGTAFAGDWAPATGAENGIHLWSHLVADPRRNIMAPEQEPTDATVFVSYVHDDDKHSGGRMVQFVKDVVGTYEFLTGRKLELFIDRDDIVWGQQWQQRLDHQLDRTAFLMPIVTPRYLTSEPCAGEIERFGSRLDQHPDSSELISLRWVDIDAPGVKRGNESVRARLAKHQYVDASEVRNLDPAGPEYRAVVERVAQRLVAAVSLREQAPSKALVSDAAANQDDDDMLGAMERFEGGQEALELAMQRFGEAFESVGEVFSDAPDLNGSSPQSMQSALANLGRRSLAPTKALTEASRDLAAAWLAMESPARRLVDLYRDAPDIEAREDLRQSIADAAASLTTPGMDDIRAQVRIMGNVSKHLRPLSRALEDALDTVASIRDGLITMRNGLDL